MLSWTIPDFFVTFYTLTNQLFLTIFSYFTFYRCYTSVLAATNTIRISYKLFVRLYSEKKQIEKCFLKMSKDGKKFVFKSDDEVTNKKKCDLWECKVHSTNADGDDDDDEEHKSKNSMYP